MVLLLLFQRLFLPPFLSSLKSFPSYWVYLRFDRESGLVRRGSNPALVVVNFHAELIFCSVSFFKAEAGNADEHTTCDAGEMTDFSFFGRLPTPWAPFGHFVHLREISQAFRLPLLLLLLLRRLFVPPFLDSLKRVSSFFHYFR